MRQILKYSLLLGLLVLFVFPAAAQTDQGSIAVGDEVTGELTSDETSHSYALDAEAGTTVSITLSSDAFDTYLTVLDDEGNILDDNDDSSGTNSAIANITLPEASSYSILVQSYSSHNGGSGEDGEYTLSVSEAEEIVVPDVMAIEYTQSVDGELTSTIHSLDYVFSGQEGDTVVIAQNSPDFDSYLYLLDSNGNEVTRNDDGGGNSNSLIGPFVLPSTGSYTIRSASYSDGGVGRFTLTLNRIDISPVAFDEDTEVTFTPADDAMYFTFEGTTGDIITISADSDGAFDTDLLLTDLYNSQVASDTSGGSGNDPEIFQQNLSQTGTYTIALTAVNPGTGKVTLTVSRTLPPSLDDGVQTISFSDSAFTRALTLTAEGGETIRLNFHVTTDAVGSPSITVIQDGTTIASVSASYVSDVNFSFTPTSDGEVIVQVTDYSYNNLSYEVSHAHEAE